MVRKAETKNRQSKISDLNNIEDERWLTEKQVSFLVGRSPGTLRLDRFYRVGIPYTKYGRSVRYMWKDVKEFMQSNRIETDDFC